MKKGMKKGMIVGLCCSVLVILIGVVVSVLGVRGDTIGIIGGADCPTVHLIFRRMNLWLKTLICFSLAIAVSALFSLIFPRLVKRVCGIKTTLTALGLSAAGAGGFYAFILLFSCYFLTSPEKHPIRYPVSGVASASAFCAFVFLLWVYVRFRKANQSILGFFLDVAVALLYFVPFMALFGAIYDTVYSVFEDQITLENLTSALFCGMMMLR